jgi:large subunit ribosomal protein L17
MHGRKLGRTSAHRKALFRNQLTALFTHERIITTQAKAKELRPIAERMVTMARTGTLPARREILGMVPDKEVVRRLFDEIAPRFMDRPGGYTRIMKLGRRRGDGAEMAIIEFVDYELSSKDERAEGGKPSLMDRARNMFGGGTKGGDAAETAEAEQVEQAAEAEMEVEETESSADEPTAEEPAADETVEETKEETKPAKSDD